MWCLWIVVVFSLGCSAALEHGLDESAANEVVTSLERAGIAANKNRDDGNGEVFVVSVAKSDVVRSMELLHSLGLPRGQRAGCGRCVQGRGRLRASKTTYLRTMVTDDECDGQI